MGLLLNVVDEVISLIGERVEAGLDDVADADDCEQSTGLVHHRQMANAELRHDGGQIGSVIVERGDV